MRACKYSTIAYYAGVILTIIFYSMINRTESIGILISVSLMALALFLLNMNTATESFQLESEGGTAAVVLSDDNPASSLSDAVDLSGKVDKLIIDDVVVGAGKSVIEGDTVSVHYIGTLQSGQQFDNSYLRGEPFEFTVGEGQVIQGWEQGILDMKVGGQRILVIPSDMAYGESGVGPIPPNATLVFAIELLEIK